MFPERSVRVTDGGKNLNGICIIDLRSHVIASRGNVGDEIFGI